VSDLAGTVLYVACLTLAGMTLATILVTGAFFSRGAGVLLASWGILLSIGTMVAAVLAPAGTWFMALPGLIMLPVFGLLLLAALGGEGD
jgi:hypothetical protein